MGLYDRDYYREAANPGSAGFGTRSLVAILIATNVGVWIVQLAFMQTGDPAEDNPFIQRYLHCSFDGVFRQGYVWQLLTANFLHDTGIFHILMNMLLLFFFGRDVEGLYGKRDFLIFYLLAGVFGMLAQITIVHDTQVVGASASVLGVMILFALHNRDRTLQLLFPPIAIKAWVICAFLVVINLLGSLVALIRDPSAPGSEKGVAYIAHLGGIGFAFLYYFVDLRWKTIRDVHLRKVFSRRPRRARRAPVQEGRVISFRKIEVEEPLIEQRDEQVIEISERIDVLLDKISQGGQDSLTEEELEFLRENSQRYRSQR